MTDDVPEPAGWLASYAVTHVAPESTGVSWEPVLNLLEGRFAVILVNARHIEQVPGREADVKDCQRIAQPLQHGLLRPSSIPPRPIRELRDLERQRTQSIRQRVTTCDRIQGVLGDAKIKLAGVASDILGASGRAMIAALIGGVPDPARMADLAKRRLRAEVPQLRRARHGQVTDHHRFRLRSRMQQVGSLDGPIERIDGRIAEATAPDAGQIERLVTIPGIDRPAAEVIVAEVGVDTTSFPTADHLGSWSGMAPGDHQGAGKRQSGRRSEANRGLRPLLVQVAWAAGPARGTLFEASYRRWAKRMGRERALVGVGHEVREVVSEVLKGQAVYQERLRPEQAA